MALSSDETSTALYGACAEDSRFVPKNKAQWILSRVHLTGNLLSSAESLTFFESRRGMGDNNGIGDTWYV